VFRDSLQNTSQELIFMDLGCCGWVFEQVDEVLADGRSFICGDRFTAADLSFAALGSIMIAPQGSGAWQPPINECPEGMASTMLCLRNTAAGKHILKMYETQRHEFVHK
jgi:glutathione S-transferase